MQKHSLGTTVSSVTILETQEIYLQKDTPD